MSALESLKEQCCKFYEELPTWGKAALAGGVAVAVYVPYRYYTTLPRKSPIKEDFQKDLVYLYQFPRSKWIPSFSPFCLKLETWLRMAEIRYESVYNGWTTRSLEGTLPFLEYNGREYPDSALAIRDMSVIHSKESMESHLTEEQRCAGRAFEKLAECSLMLTVAQIRYIEFMGEVFTQFPPNTFAWWAGPWIWMMKQFGPGMVAKNLKLMGMGKHSRIEVLNIAADDLRAISRFLGTKNYLLGFKATKADAAVFSVLAQIVYAPYDLPQKQLVLDELKNLKDYCERIKQRYWPDWDECTLEFKQNTDYMKKL